MMLSPGRNIDVAYCIRTVLKLPPLFLTCSSALHGALMPHRSGLWAMAIQWTVPSRLHDVTTASISIAHSAHGVMVLCGVPVRMGVGVFVRGGVLAGV